GERLGSPRHVHFAAEMAHHLLQWEPGHNSPSDVRYEVEHKVYGTNFSWTAIPNCMRISGHSCDLTYYTLDPALRYYARVRAVSGNHTSPWKRTNSFSPQEASLRLSGQSLSVTGNTVHVQLQLLRRVGNTSVRYEDIQKHARRYVVYVRRAQDNRTYQVVETTPKFNISSLFWDTEYCISVEPDVASRRIRATRTDEQCITTARRHKSAEFALGIVGSSFITLLFLGLLGSLLVCVYIKQPVRTPAVLKSFIKQSSLWVEQESSSSGSPDTDPVQQLFLDQKEPQQNSGLEGNTGTAQLPLEKGWRLPGWSEDWLRLPGLGAAGSRDSSCASTDSGICLHAPELGCSSGPEPQGYRQQLPTGDDSGLGLESGRLGPACSSSSGSPIPAEPLQPYGGELSQPDLQFRGYLQQSKGTVQPRWDTAKALPFSGWAGCPQGPGSADVVLEVESSELAVPKGYLKQSSAQHPLRHTQDLASQAAPLEPTAWDFPSQMGPQAPTLLNYRAPGALSASKAGAQLLKAPFNLNNFNTDLLGTLPLISSLSTNKWLMLQIDPLSLLNRDSKDSRL
ncbi:I10R1 protein, partial [Urocolius indicus]|nr:I10R1 protein [Urocolius indicus]